MTKFKNRNIKVLALNGPPHCGKDTLAGGLRDVIHSSDWTGDYAAVLIQPMAEGMRLTGFQLLGEPYSSARYAELKETEIPEFGGKTFRQFMIDLSEKHMKVEYGENVFARLWLRKLEFFSKHLGKLPILVVIPDAGFNDEQYEVAKAVGFENYQMIYVAREGTDWSKDSRAYVNFNDPQIHVASLANDGTVNEAVEKLQGIISERGW